MSGSCSNRSSDCIRIFLVMIVTLVIYNSLMGDKGEKDKDTGDVCCCDT